MDFVHSEEAFPSPATAFAVARDLVAAELDVLGTFVLPPADGAPTRDFQTLHVDFGVPLDPRVRAPVAFATALHVPLAQPEAGAATRLVPLAELLAQRAWAPREELRRRWARYGVTHGAWPGADGYVEGSLARIVEASADVPPALPSVKAHPDFRCGLEFAGLAEELAFFARHGLAVEQVEVEVVVRPGELLVFDNLAFAHGRRGVRQPGELHQRVFGRILSPPAQASVRERLLDGFARPSAVAV
jgi:hypothetical protein